jgi:hypothetical protein
VSAPNKPVARVEAHLEALRAAGLDTQAFFDALVAIRDDSALSETQRDALHRIIAMESFIWYLEALRGEPVDRIKAAEEARKLADAPAIEKREPGQTAAELAKRDLSIGKDTFPREEVTVKQRPPKKPPAAKTINQRPPVVDAEAEPKGPTRKAGVTKFDGPEE